MHTIVSDSGIGVTACHLRCLAECRGRRASGREMMWHGDDDDDDDGGDDDDDDDACR